MVMHTLYPGPPKRSDIDLDDDLGRPNIVGSDTDLTMIWIRYYDLDV
jgi:hypothetical protein